LTSSPRRSTGPRADGSSGREAAGALASKWDSRTSAQGSGPNPFSYDAIVYTVRPFPFEIGQGATALTADGVAVPEPARIVLFGTGLAGAALARRRRRPRDA
jgi:hypothetical protein